MADTAARLYLMTPLLEDDSFAPRLEEACAAGEVAAVMLRLAPADERTLINRIKTLAPVAQKHGAAVMISVQGDADLATLAARGGAEGAHVLGNLSVLKSLRDSFKTERSVGVGSIRSKDDAMAFGEAGADYLMFGEPRADGSLPTLETVIERAAWWAEIFETPCAAYAPRLEDVAALVATNVEFIALGDAVWDHPDGPAAAVKNALAVLAAQETAP